MWGLIIAGIVWAALWAPHWEPQRLPSKPFRFRTVPRAVEKFCAAFPEECLPGSSAPIVLTKERYAALEEVNRTVNQTMWPTTDEDLYGVRDLWTLAYGAGDCEDLAIRKRHELIGRGWPAGALLLTIGHDNLNDGHAWLTVKTTTGNLVLDSRNDDILAAADVPYRPYARQSASNPRIWTLQRR
jgi:predicted transglutaminase-like cysteine proteinase